MSQLTIRLQDLATRTATEAKALHIKVGSLTNLNTTDRSSIVASVNELVTALAAVSAAAGAQIDDAQVASLNKTWSVSKIQAELLAFKDSLTDGAGAALDTLAELAAAIGNDENFAASITTALANRVRFDQAQALTTAQKQQALDNIGGVSTTAIGDPDVDLVAVFNAGLL